MKVGLVLEGGGMRGLYTAGVLDAFLEAGIKVDGVVSVSAGALFGVNYLSNQPKREKSPPLQQTIHGRPSLHEFLVMADNWELCK